MKLLSLALPAVLVLAPSSAAQIGSVVRAQKINEQNGGLVGPVSRLGYSLAALGDLNGDGVGDLVAGLPEDSTVGPDHGALLVLFLNANGTVAAQQKISEAVGGLVASLPSEAYFGVALAAPGDLDGDGLQELAVRSEIPRSTWILFLNPNGTVRAQREIPWSDPVFGGATVASDFASVFVRGFVGMGDLDGDGVGDLALGAPGDDDGYTDAGAIWFLYLNPDGSARAAKKLSETSGGLAGSLAPGSGFGQSLARLGDVNGDGFVDLSAAGFGGGFGRRVLFLGANQDVIGSADVRLTEVFTAIGDLDGDGLAEVASEGFHVNFLAGDGHVRRSLSVTKGHNGMPLDPDMRGLGTYSIAALGDLDGDGAPELAVSDFMDTQSGGAVWIVSLARTPVRDGSGTNPLLLSEGAEPVIGQTWHATLDCSGHASGLAALVGHAGASAGTFVPGGELLVDLTSSRLFVRLAAHSGAPLGFTAAVPNDPALVDLQLYAQGLCGGAPGLTLSNALGLLVGQ